MKKNRDDLDLVEQYVHVVGKFLKPYVPSLRLIFITYVICIAIKITELIVNKFKRKSDRVDFDHNRISTATTAGVIQFPCKFFKCLYRVFIQNTFENLTSIVVLMWLILSEIRSMIRPGLDAVQPKKDHIRANRPSRLDIFNQSLLQIIDKHGNLNSNLADEPPPPTGLNLNTNNNNNQNLNVRLNQRKNHLLRLKFNFKKFTKHKMKSNNNKHKKLT